MCADVTENKRTDGATTHDKEMARMALAADFNAASTVKRDRRQLKQVISVTVNAADKWCRFGFSAAAASSKLVYF